MHISIFWWIGVSFRKSLTCIYMQLPASILANIMDRTFPLLQHRSISDGALDSLGGHTGLSSTLYFSLYL